MHGCCPKNEKPEKDTWERNWWVPWVGAAIIGGILGFLIGLFLLAPGFGALGYAFDYGLLLFTTTVTGIFTVVVGLKCLDLPKLFRT